MINAIESIKRLFIDEEPSFSGVKSPRIGGLDTLRNAERATIIGLNVANELQGRLLGMGMTIGAKVEVLQDSQSLYKPLLIAVGETRIALGRDIAKMILVELDIDNH